MYDRTTKIIENLPHKYGNVANHNSIRGNEVSTYNRYYGNHEELPHKNKGYPERPTSFLFKLE